MEGDSLENEYPPINDDGTSGTITKTPGQLKEINMNEEQEQVKEDNSNTNDITSIETILEAMDEEEKQDESIEIQDRDYLSEFLEKYIKLMKYTELQNDEFQKPLDFQKPLGVLLMRMFLEKIYKVYELNKPYNVEIRPINLTIDQAEGLLALINELRPLIRDRLSEMYDDLPDNKDKPRDRKSIRISIY